MSRNADRRPNVVIFFTDQQRWDSTGVHGNPLDLTPNFDRTAKRGTHAPQAYTCQPVCLPARAALQTGIYPSRIGCHTNGGRIAPAQKTLGHYFREAGYRTGYIGKWHLDTTGCEAVAPEVRTGYEYWLGANVLEYTSDAYFTVLYDTNGKPVELPGFRVDAVADAGIRYMHEHRHEPFFLMMSFIEPHFQNHRDDYPAPVGYAERYAGRWTPPDLQELGGTAGRHLGGYWGMVKRLDEAFGRVQDALTSMGLAENTIVLFTTDHGCHFKTRNSEYKRSCHESSTRIPMVLTGGEFTGGGELPGLVSLIDLPPTLLDAAGLSVPAEMQGRSLMPLVRRQSRKGSDEVFIQISESMCGRAIRHGRWKYAVKQADDADWGKPAAARYVEDFLYDLQADPYELRNLIGVANLDEVKALLRGRLIAKIKEIEGLAAEIVPAESKGAGHLYGWNLRSFGELPG
jgi:arylsulfatase A-like enzyme